MIEKKIGLKLLYVFLMCFASLLLSLLLFPVSSNAASEYAVNKVVNDIYSNLGITESSNSASVFLDYWNGVKTTYPYAFAYTNTSKTYIRYYMVGNASVDDSKVYYTDGSIYISHNTGQDFPASPSSVSGGSSGNFPLTSSSYFGNYDDYTVPAIDWNNPYYSANIQSPNVNITYREFTSVPTIDVPLNVTFLNDLENYYFESFAIFCQPETVMVTVENGQYVYDGFDYQNIWRPLVNMQDLQKPSDYSVDSFHLLMNDAWYNSRLTDGMIDFIYPTGFSANSQTNASSKYNNLRKNQCMACNQIYLYFRYFTVIDGQVVVGPWRIWSSYDPSVTTEEIPEYIQPYLPAVGTTGTTTQINPVSTSSPEPTQIYNPSTTGSNVNVTVTQNVPNYPDYPTIASYNKDNLLVDTMNQLTSIQGFFGEFGSFLVAAFAFMPAWIWAIIGVGFSLSIVVMFLKIL